MFLGIIGSTISFFSKDENFEHFSGNSLSENKIALISLKGPIFSEPFDNLYFNNLNRIDAIYPSLIKEYLNQLSDHNILGVIISIDSPGGSVSATNRIYNWSPSYTVVIQFK